MLKFLFTPLRAYDADTPLDERLAIEIDHARAWPPNYPLARVLAESLQAVRLNDTHQAEAVAHVRAVRRSEALVEEADKTVDAISVGYEALRDRLARLHRKIVVVWDVVTDARDGETTEALRERLQYALTADGGVGGAVPTAYKGSDPL